MSRVDELLTPARTAVLALLVLAIAAILRLHDLQIVGLNFDSYEQINATQRLLDGETPISRIYPPGVAAILAPVFAVFPDTLGTTQLVIIVASLALVALSFAAARAATQDEAVALAFSLAVAVSPALVFYSRVVLFDVINTLGVALAVFGVPYAARRPHLAAVYGVVLALTLLIRITNTAMLPAIAVYWWYEREQDGSDRRQKLAPAATAVTAAAASVVALCLISGFPSQSPRIPFNLSTDMVGRLAGYGFVTFSDLTAIFVLPAAVIGFRVLLPKRGLALAACLIVVLWPLVHAPVDFLELRYMLPALYFALFLASVGAVEFLRRQRVRSAAAVAGWIAVTLFLAVQISRDAVVLQGWDERADRSDEAAYRDLRPHIASLPAGSLVVTTHARGFEAATADIEFVDLIDVGMHEGIDDASVAQVVAEATRAHDDGRAIYYLYGDLDDGERGIGLHDPGFGVYFDALRDRFGADEEFRSSVDEFRLYRLGGESN